MGLSGEKLMSSAIRPQLQAFAWPTNQRRYSPHERLAEVRERKEAVNVALWVLIDKDRDQEALPPFHCFSSVPGEKGKARLRSLASTRLCLNLSVFAFADAVTSAMPFLRFSASIRWRAGAEKSLQARAIRVRAQMGSHLVGTDGGVGLRARAHSQGQPLPHDLGDIAIGEPGVANAMVDATGSTSFERQSELRGGVLDVDTAPPI